VFIQIKNLDNGSEIFELHVDELPALLGSHRDANVRLADPLVEPLHCMIDGNDGGLSVLALTTRSGTLVNGTRVIEAPLEPGDCLTIGSTCLTVDYFPHHSGHAPRGPDPGKPR
jgi:hypothetical protein